MPRFFLGLETSCDDTGAAIVSDDREILSNIVVDQAALHDAFGGIVPEIAARAHTEKLDVAVQLALDEAELKLSDVDAIAVTSGPGLIGGVLSGVMMAKGLAAGLNKPLIGVNHLAGHALTPRLTHDVSFPFLLLLVSGGHCQLLIVKAADHFVRLGGTIDDAPGEAFDKSARLLGLPQPGGPNIERLAQEGDASSVPLPRPLLDREGCDMSFSGLKTALRRERDRLVAQQGGLYRKDQANLAASFQQAVADVLKEKTKRAVAMYLQSQPSVPVLAVAGGVAANTVIRGVLEAIAEENGLGFVAPPLPLCTDNAAMIAWAGVELDAVRAGCHEGPVARPRWPLDSSQPALLGSGKKGAKA
ncbi:MAG: tRNA (adenosine(37)-N6)-threonylcarbamoyltransferase complex transferase subunit TsaD [Pseudomonadota bacterium]